MTTCALYLRVSTDQQDTDNQLLQLRQHCESRGWQITEVYRENESAWRAGHQAELSRLMDDVKRHRRKFDYVLCWALDRMTRQGPAAVLSLAHTIKLYGSQLVSYQESWTEAPGGTGDLLLSIFGWIAQQESERRSERTKAGLQRTLKSGVTKKGKKITQLGRPKGSKDRDKRRKKRPVVFKYAGVSVTQARNTVSVGVSVE